MNSRTNEMLAVSGYRVPPSQTAGTLALCPALPAGLFSSQWC